MEDTEEHIEIRNRIREYRNYNVEDEIKMEEINEAIKKFKNNKAPGLDGFNIEIIKAVWNGRPDILHGLLNNCYRQEVFPKEWKMADLKIILKDQNRDKKMLSSYRPIALLSKNSESYMRE